MQTTRYSKSNIHENEEMKETSWMLILLKISTLLCLSGAAAGLGSYSYILLSRIENKVFNDQYGHIKYFLILFYFILFYEL